MQYEFKNGVVLELPEKLMITAINSLVCYLIVKISYADPLLITKLIVLGIEFKFPRETSFTNDGTAKPRKKIRLDQRVPRRAKN